MDYEYARPVRSSSAERNSSELASRSTSNTGGYARTDPRTTAETYRDLARDAGVRIVTVSPETMDRLVFDIANGIPTSEAFASAPAAPRSAEGENTM